MIKEFSNGRGGTLRGIRRSGLPSRERISGVMPIVADSAACPSSQASFVTHSTASPSTLALPSQSCTLDAFPGHEFCVQKLLDHLLP